jgi:hypothetical protein
MTPALRTLDHALTAWTEAKIVVRQSTLLADGRLRVVCERGELTELWLVSPPLGWTAVERAGSIVLWRASTRGEDR